ncbi:LuxR C-terminal-related transcriptional regulator [Streptomyces sp. NPDC047017]|uniref:LuxR C-terminal-related transcriptional regulator n=1 Tax=Streptomyces sp. NPDC047017 TaxID=3155024 RepID=UPI0033F98CBE
MPEGRDLDAELPPQDYTPELLAALRQIERLLRDLLPLLERLEDTAPTPTGPGPRTEHGRTGPPAPEPARRRRLTPREEEILTLLLTGMSNRAISRRIGLTERTVKNNLHVIYRKLDVTGRAETIARFLNTAAPRQRDPRADRNIPESHGRPAG